MRSSQTCRFFLTAQIDICRVVQVEILCHLDRRDTFSVEDRSWRVNLKIVPSDREALPECLSTRRELVTITVLREDYAKLKAVGGPHPLILTLHCAII